MSTQTIEELSQSILNELDLHKTDSQEMKVSLIGNLIVRSVKDWWVELDDRGNLNTTYENLVRKEILKKGETK